MTEKAKYKHRDRDEQIDRGSKYKQSEIEMNRMTEKSNINRVRQRQNGKNKIIKCEGGGRKKLKFIT